MSAGPDQPPDRSQLQAVIFTGACRQVERESCPEDWIFLPFP
jgi:hypothetical protein